MIRYAVDYLKELKDEPLLATFSGLFYTFSHGDIPNSPLSVFAPFGIRTIPKTTKNTETLSDFRAVSWRCHPDSNWGIKVLQTFALPLGYGTVKNGAVDEARTRDLNLGKVALYQLSYYRMNGALGRNRTTDT